MSILPSSVAEARQVGARHYYTGEPCKRGHVVKRLASTRSCVECSREHSQKFMREKRSDPEKREGMNRQWREWYHSGNQAKRVENTEKWRGENREKVRAITRRGNAKFRSTPEGVAYCFAVKCLSRCLKNKTDRTFSLLGYTKRDLVRRIESRFLPGMSWDNYGEWHIDHIVPVSYWIKRGEEDPAKINALDNLTPLWARDNISKGAKFRGGE